MTFTDVNGISCTQQITDRWNNDFSRSKPEEFKLELPGLVRIISITIERNEANRNDDW